MSLRIYLETKEGRHVHTADIDVAGEDDWPEVISFDGRLFMIDDLSHPGIVTYTEALSRTLEPPPQSPDAN